MPHERFIPPDEEITKVMRERMPTRPGPPLPGDPRKRLERREWLSRIDCGFATKKSLDPDKERCEDRAKIYEEARLGYVCDGVSKAAAGDLAAEAVGTLLENAQRPSENPSAARKLLEPYETPQTEEDIERALYDFMIEAHQQVRLSFGTVAVQRRIQDLFKKRQLIPGSEKANEALLQYERNQLTTCTLFKGWRNAAGEDHFSIGHVGDTRVYRRRDVRLARLTEDDSFIQPFVSLGLLNEMEEHRRIGGKEIREAERMEGLSHVDGLRLDMLRAYLVERNTKELSVGELKGPVLQSLGQRLGRPRPQILSGEVRDGDEFYLMVDGIYANLPDQNLEGFLAAHAAEQTDPQVLSEQLIRAAQEAQLLYDDMTVAIIRYTRGKFITMTDRLAQLHEPL